ncbi:MAG: sugar ABC transporter permease, partial [Firmicutes bacterium]|nr:sugar ABC transporter permease [Bacillota bacterium]
FNVMFGSTNSGLINQVIMLFGGDPQKWLVAVGSSHFNMGVVIIVYSIWEGIAFKILVFMSGLASIDKQYYDAARVDGTSRARIFSRITVPLLSPQILYITITSFIGAFKAYSSVISLFGAGAYNFGGITGKSWITVVGYIYIAMRDSKTARAAAGSIVLLCIILVITVLQFWVSKKRVHY